MSKALADGWTWAKLPELGDFGRGKSKHRPRNDPKLYGGDYPFIQTGDVTRARGRIASHSQTYNDVGLAQSKLWPAGTVCVTIAANIAESGILSYPACFPDSVVGLIPNKKKCTAEYVEYFLRTARARLADYAPSTAQKNINLGILNEVAVPLPPVQVQRRIADILGKADAIRRKRQEAIGLTESLLRSAFLEMFGDPVTNPKGWTVAPIGDVAEVQGGLQVTAKRKSQPIVVPYLRVANVYRDRLDLNEIKEIRVTENELERVRLQRGDILMVEGHGNRNEIGRSAVWDGSIDPCLHRNHLIRVRVSPKRALPEFVSAYLNSPGGRRQLFRFGKTTSGLNTISTGNVKATTLLLPPLAKQSGYIDVLNRVAHMRGRLHDTAEHLTELFSSLVQRAFRGDL